jgi:hypothetical protein
LFHDKVYFASVADTKTGPGKDIYYKKEGGDCDGGCYGSVDEAYLMNDRGGQTIERLA